MSTFDEILEKAGKGDVFSQMLAGYTYQYGDADVAQNTKEAIKWYSLAAKQGNAEAQHALALCYCNDALPNMQEAAKWFLEAAKQGKVDSQYEIGCCYHDGEGVDQDSAEAVKWFRLAVQHEHPEAQYRMGLCYSDGDGVEKDEVEAARWFRLSAEQDCVFAQAMLGYYYYQGRGGLERDLNQALRWAGSAYKQGFEGVGNLLGRIFLELNNNE